MRFGAIPLDEAEGAVLAHALRVGKLAYKKGRKLSAADIEALRASGVGDVIAAKLEPGEVEEDEAARLIAEAIAGEHVRIERPFTGRVNLFAEQAGLLVLDHARIDRLNRLDEAVTIATLAAFAEVLPKQMVATVKIIPFAAPRRGGRAMRARALPQGPLLRVAPYRGRSMSP